MIRFTFDGRDVATTATHSLAAALTQAGVRAFRTTDSAAPRGMFCGMGICQECLVNVDGLPNQRACMIAARDGMIVETQTARPSLTAPPDQALIAERRAVDVLVIGGGAAGLNAAIAAREAGAEVLLLDERKVPGGQYFKQSSDPETVPMDPQQAQGQTLVQAARAAGTEILSGVEVWGAFDTGESGPEIMAADATHVYALTPRALIVATGAYERPLMIPGWTLPGVMTVGAAQTLWRSYGALPGKRVAVFGNGPLNAQVALELAQGGADVAFLAEAAPGAHKRPRAAARMLRADPALSIKGLRMLLDLRRRGITLRNATMPVGIESTQDALKVSYTGPRGEGSLVVDTICMNFGFQPQNEILRLLGAKLHFDPRFAQLRPERSQTCETSVPGVYAVGDCCGLGGAPAAAVEGRIAGRAAAGQTAPTKAQIKAQTKTLARHSAFQDALWQLYEAPLPVLDDLAPDTLVCRCEEVTKATLDAALADGLTDVGAVKRATRIGMGRCQGRYCAPALAGHMASRSATPPQDLSFFAPRVPIKPVSIGTLVAAQSLIDAPHD